MSAPGQTTAPTRRAGRAWPLAALAAVIIVPLCLWSQTRGTVDVDLWLAWMRQVLHWGPRQGFSELQGDYPPFASLVLWFVGRTAQTASVDPHSFLKWTLFAALLVTTGILLVASRRPGLSAFGHAALLWNAFVLMYLDILTAPFVLGAIWAANAGRGPVLIGLLVMASFLKWQPMFLLPFAAIFLLRSLPTADAATQRRQFWLSAAVAAVLIAGALSIYGAGNVYAALNRAGHHNNLSNYGANPLWVLTWWFERTASPGRQALSPEGLATIMAAGRPMIRILSVISLVAFATVMRKYWKSNDPSVAGFVRFSLAGYLVYFMCSVGVHENHLFLASLLALALAWLEPRRLWMAIVLAIAANLNLMIFYGVQGFEIARVWHGIDLSIVLAAATSIAVSVIVWRLASSRNYLTTRNP